MNEDKSPKIILEGTIFRIDVDSQSLIELDNPGNRILKSAMTAEGNTHTMTYDPACRNIATKERRLLASIDELTEISLPEKLFHLKAIPSNPNVDGYNRKSCLKNWGYILVNEDLDRYLTGEQPSIGIAGVGYSVDVKENRLTPISATTYPSIYLDYADFWDNGNKRLLFYDLNNGNVIDLPVRLEALHSQVALVEIPDLVRIDPIGFARMMGEPDTGYIDAATPFALHQVANVISVQKFRSLFLHPNDALPPIRPNINSGEIPRFNSR